MPLDIQFKLKENPLYIKYLRENNIWYKRLIRNPNSFNTFVAELKANYRLRPTDKLNDIAETINVVTNLLSSMI